MSAWGFTSARAAGFTTLRERNEQSTDTPASWKCKSVKVETQNVANILADWQSYKCIITSIFSSL